MGDSDDSSINLATIIRGFANNAHGATLVGDPWPVTRTFQERMSNVELGDLVVEQSTRRSPEDDLNAVGWLEETAWEKVDFGDPEFVWDEDAEGEPHPTEQIFYIRTLDGRRFRWSNARFIAVPFNPLPR